MRLGNLLSLIGIICIRSNMDKIKFNNDRQKIISWINSHDHSMAEIEFVLSKAYPEGSEDSFYDDYGDLLEKCDG